MIGPAQPPPTGGPQDQPPDWCPLRLLAVLMILAGAAVLVWTC